MNQPLSKTQLVFLTMSLSMGIFMNVLDSSIANVAIPTLAGDLAVSADQGTWVITSFAASQAIMLPITGWLARRFGEVKLFVVSTFLFTVVSILCGLAVNLPMLVFFRALQGVVSGPMIPLSQSILLANYPETKKNLATALWVMTAILGPIFGPIIGGYITDNYTWPWIFYINLPIGIFASGVTWMLLAKRESVISREPIDIIGLICLIVGVGCLQIMVDKGNDLDWFHSNEILALGIIGLIAMITFLIWEMTEKNPVIDLSLFLNRNFVVGTSALTLGFMVYFSNLVVFPLWLQTQMGYTPLWAGLAAFPVGVLPFLLTPLVGLYMGKFDLRMVVSIGFCIFAITSFWQADFYTDVGYLELIKPRFAQGLGLAFFFAPLSAILLSGLPATQTASALGLANFFRILGGSVGTSLSITSWQRREAFHHTMLVENINPYNPASVSAMETLQSLGFSKLQSLGKLAKSLSSQSIMMATDDVFWMSGTIFIFLLVIVWFARPPFLLRASAAAE